MIRLRHAFAAGAFALLAPSVVLAQACPGPSPFGDVQQNAIFCKNTEWLANRAVTLGCADGPPPLYCPNQAVLRSQMALFMNRLGTALTPTLVRVQDADFPPPTGTPTFTNFTYDPPLRGCISAPILIAGFPRQATLHASFMNYNASSAKTVIGQFVYSTNGGATWVSTGDYQFWQDVNTGQGRITMGLVGGPIPLAVGTEYMFAIQASTNDFSATVQGECQMLVRIENRNSDTQPF